MSRARRPDPVLVTGGTGYLGNHIVRTLLARGRAVRCLVRRRPPGPNLERLPVELATGHLTDPAALHEALRGVTQVVHAAGLVSFRARDRRAVHTTNAAGSALLAQLAREHGIARFVHVSSTAALGAATGGQPADEDTPWNLAGYRVPYCDSKRAAEQAVRAECARGLPAVVVAPATLLGPGDRRPAAHQTVRAARDGAFRLAPPGGLCIADVRDVADACVAALERGTPGERYILGGHNLSGRAFVDALCRATGCAAPRHTIPAWICRPAAVLIGLLEATFRTEPPWTRQLVRLAGLRFHVDDRRARRVLGYRSRPLDQTLTDTVAEIPGGRR